MMTEEQAQQVRRTHQWQPFYDLADTCQCSTGAAGWEDAHPVSPDGERVCLRSPRSDGYCGYCSDQMDNPEDFVTWPCPPVDAANHHGRSITIASADFARLIRITREYVPASDIHPLHGIRLEARDGWVWAVATDRYTLAAVRYPLSEPVITPWTATIDVEDVNSLVAALPAWSQPLELQHTPTIDGSVDGPLLYVTGPDGRSWHLPERSAQYCPDWRALLGRLLREPAQDSSAVAIRADLVERFHVAARELGQHPVWHHHGPSGPVTVAIGSHFRAALMPTRPADIGTPADIREWLAACPEPATPVTHPPRRAPASVDPEPAPVGQPPRLPLGAAQPRRL